MLDTLKEVLVLGMIHNHTIDTKIRHVFLHYHIFKNSGTTIDFILEKNFGAGVAHLHSKRQDTPVSNTDLLEFLHANPEITAVSSHQLRFPKPESESFVFFDIVFLRHPLDRLRSIFDFYRHAELNGDPLAEQARRLGLGQFLEVLLDFHPHMINDVQVNFLANAGRYMRPPCEADLNKAARIITQAAVPGATEIFDLSMNAAKYYLYPAFGQLNLEYVRQNVAPDHSESLQVRLLAMKEQCDSGVHDKLVEMNKLDLQLLEVAHAEIQRRVRLAPRLGSAGRNASMERGSQPTTL